MISGKGLVAVFVVAIVALSPLPFGGVRPQFWALTACSIAVVSAMLLFSPARLAPLRELRVSAALQSLVCLFLLLQLLALPNGSSVPAPQGLDIANRTSISLAPGSTWLMLMRQVGYGLFLFLVLQAGLNRERARRMLLAVYGSVVVYGALGLLMLVQWQDTLFGLPKTAYLGFVTGPFVNHNNFAMFLAIGMSVGVAWLLQLLAEDRAVPQKAMAIAALVASLLILVAALFGTGSRLGLVSGLAASATIIVLGIFHVFRPKASVWAMLIVVAASALVLAGLVFGGAVLLRFASIDLGADPRWELYGQVWAAILSQPWLGHGGGSFEWAFAHVARPPLNPDMVWEKAHSTYLQLWFELGIIVGSLPIVAVLWLLARSAVGFVGRRSNWAVALAALGSAIAVGLQSLFDFGLEIPANMYLFLAVAGLGAASSMSTTGTTAPPTAGRQP